MSSNLPSGNERDQFAPYTSAPPIKYVDVEINVSFDVMVSVPEDYNRTHLIAEAEKFRDRYDIAEEVAFVEENI